MKMLGILFLTLLLPSNAKAALNKEDPGKCGKWRARQTVIVDDKDGNERILICLKDNGSYKWKELDNLSSIGEYYKPGKDCTDIVKNNKQARTGHYWINGYGLNEEKKVWCDVDGFLLIGYKGSPESWMHPSNSDIVTPTGSPHWSSAFGNVSMTEFRVQVTSRNDAKDIKADWLYHFNSPRLLSELLMNGKGGCHIYPGVGDINYVKDLRMGKIVSRNFQCSQFGPSYPSNLGWRMMNNCLKKPCKKGYAILPGSNQTRYDNYGGFSYSASARRSGMNLNSTAFVGCEHGKCCSCFGPEGETGDFCSPGCRGFNNGTVSNNTQTFFWIRSSVPPQPLWTRCTEYTVHTSNKTEMHYIDAKTGVVVKGSCARAGIPNIIDGVVNVANDASLNAIAKIKGLLAFRKDVSKLYLYNGSSWEPFATENQNQELFNKLTMKQMELSRIYNELKNLTARLETDTMNLEIQYQEIVNKNQILEVRSDNLTEMIQSLRNVSTRLEMNNIQLEMKINLLEKKLNETVTDCSCKNQTITTPSTPPTPIPPKPTTVPPTVAPPGTSCNDILLNSPNATSGVYWIQPNNTHIPAFAVYCDMETFLGGWTLVYSYTFTEYNHFFSKHNAVTPRPNWPVQHANVPVSLTPPLEESARGALDWNLWKNIGSEFLIKSNINDWIACKPLGGSIVTHTHGPLNCTNIKDVVKACQGLAPTRIAWHKYGPYLSATSVFYDFVSTTKYDWPAHDPCGRRRSNERKGVINPGGAIFLR